MNLIWFIPVSVLLGAALFIALINRGKANIGAAWFAAIIAALFVWGWTISLYWRYDFRSGEIFSPGVSWMQVQAVENTGDPSAVPQSGNMNFVLDRVSYPYMLAVSALLVILLLTAPSYMEPQTAPRLWFFYLLIEAIGYMTVSAHDVSFFIYGWVIFDGIDLVTQYLQSRPGMIRRNFQIAIGIRFIGTIMAAASLAYSMSDPDLSGRIFITPAAGAFLLVACALRMGILPISQPYSDVSVSRVGLGTMLRLVSALTVMPVLSRTPLLVMSLDMNTLLSLAGGVASLTGTVGWLLSENSAAGNTYAALAVSGMAFVSALSGEQDSLIAWGISLVLTCAPLSLYQIHNPFMNVFAGLLIVAFSGLPYTPNAVGWFGLVRAPYSVKDILFVLVAMLFMGGGFVHILRAEGRKFSELEPWMRSVYPLGFLAAIGIHVFISVICYDEPFSLGVIPASVSAFIGAVFLAVFIHRLPERLRTQNLIAWGRESVSFFWRVMKKVLDMEWLLAAFRLAARGIRVLIGKVSVVLENNGGLVWELLLLAVLLAAAYSGDLL